MENFTIDVDGDGIALITWDMPDRSMNVLSQSSMRETSQWINRVISDDAVRGAVLTSAKPAFCAGADLAELGDRSSDGPDTRSEEDKLRAKFESGYGLNSLLRELETCGKPVAAAINGTALGGGLEVTLACHYRVVADNPKIQLGLPEAKVGLLPGGGGTQRLPRLIGIAAAMPLILEGKSVSPHEAEKAGIVHKVVPADKLIAEAKRWVRDEGDAEQPWDNKGYKIPGGGPHDPKGAQNFVIGNALLRGKTYGNYPAQKYIMSCVYEGSQVPIEAGLRIESRYFVKLMNQPEAKNMVRSLFLSTQELSKGARRPQGVDKEPVIKLGVLGAGVMGAGIAYVSALAGIDVVLLDRDQQAADSGKDYAKKAEDKLISKGRSTEQKRDQILAHIHPSTNYDDLKGCDLVIEAVFEDRQIKADVTRKTEAVVEASAIFGSNTSTLPITGLAEASERPENFIGIHFFSPVERMGLVELICGEKTSDKALAKAIDYVGQIRKTPIVVNDSRGFYTSRCVGTFTGEGMEMVGEGISPALVENAARMSGMPMGALELMDSVGSDTALKIARQTRKDLGIEEVPPAEQFMAWIVDEHGRSGRKVGKGFYDYSEGGSRGRLWPELFTRRNDWKTDLDVEELKKRFLYRQAVEAARCVEEGVVTDPRDGDVGAILGWGFAPFTGGPLSLIDTVGTRKFVAECDRMAEQYGERFKPGKLLREMAETDDTFYNRFGPEKRAA